MMRELKRALAVFIALSIATGLIYPLAITGAARLLFPRQAGGSLLVAGGKTVGSELIGQAFTRPDYFHGRPSAVDCDAAGSGASNLGPSSAKLVDQARGRVEQVRRENGLLPSALVPADLALASGSGLDPDITPRAALLQAARVARARGLSTADVVRLVRERIERPQFGLWGQPRVNVVKLNRALDAMSRGRTP
jgi:K+-transporting ATPase ATPase C chain